jgi:hypothetical protein
MKNAKNNQNRALKITSDTLRVLGAFELPGVNGGRDTETQSNNGCGPGPSGKQTGCSACVF